MPQYYIKTVKISVKINIFRNKMQALETRKRLIFSLAVLPVGIALLIYGAFFHSIEVFEKSAADHDVISTEAISEQLSELNITLETTRDGVVRLDTGKIHSTRQAGEPPAAFCPT